jgi:hypothetical protein
MVVHGASREVSEARFWDHLADEGDTVDSLRRKIDLLLYPDAFISCDLQDDDQMPLTSPPESALSVLTPEQHSVASQIIDAVMQKTNQLMFLQGSAWTGKTFTVKALIKALESTQKKCLICGTTGITAVQYPGETTLHSLFHFGINEQLSVVSVQMSDTVLLWLGTSLPLI